MIKLTLAINRGAGKVDLELGIDAGVRAVCVAADGLVGPFGVLDVLGIEHAEVVGGIHAVGEGRLPVKTHA